MWPKSYDDIQTIVVKLIVFIHIAQGIYEVPLYTNSSVDARGLFPIQGLGAFCSLFGSCSALEKERKHANDQEKQ